MTPTKIILEKTATHVHLMVFAPETMRGFTVIEGTPFANDGPKEKTLLHLRKCGAKYAKRFNIPFVDQTV